MKKTQMRMIMVAAMLVKTTIMPLRMMMMMMMVRRVTMKMMKMMTMFVRMMTVTRARGTVGADDE